MTSFAIIGLGFGDEGKGAVVDALARKLIAAGHPPPLVVRHNGGGQAGHNVVTDDGKHHTFSQFGAGTFAGCPTYLSRFFVLNPGGLQKETEALRAKEVNRFDYLAWNISGDALVTTPFHQAANQLRELCRGAAAHGTVGIGFGETVADSIARPDLALRVQDIHGLPGSAFTKRLKAIQAYKADQLRVELDIAAAKIRDPAVSTRQHHAYAHASTVLTDEVFDWRGFGSGQVSPQELQEIWREIVPVGCVVADEAYFLRGHVGPILYEGAQGVLLDEWHGFHPHTTWSTTTAKNAVTLHREAQRPESLKVIGVTRTYMTRHGQGPFPTELPRRVVKALGWDVEPHNTPEGWQGEFAAGWPSAPLIQYAKAVCRLPGHGGIDHLAITHLDRVESGSTTVMDCFADPVAPPSDASRDDAYLASRQAEGERLSSLTSVLSAGRYTRPFINEDGDDGRESFETLYGAKLAIQGCGPSALYYKVEDRLIEESK